MKWIAVALGCLAVLAPGAEGSRSAAPPLSVVWAEPATSQKVMVERLAAAAAGIPERWRMNLDVLLKNAGRATLRVFKIEISYPGTSIPTRSAAPDTRVLTIASLAQQILRVPENRDHAFPIAPNVKLSIYAEGYDSPFVVTRPLTEAKLMVAGGAYLFPIKREDLPDGMYVVDSQNHIWGSKHRMSTTQRFAYDFGVRRWNGDVWTRTRENGDSKTNEGSLIWGLPVYAMADGWVLRCVKGVEDNPKPGVKGTAGGNIFWIVHKPGEVALYAHFQHEKTDEKLCPRSGVNLRPNAVKVKAGQFLGLAGNSGQSGGPHLHVHLETTGLDSPAGQGIPLLFRRTRARFVGKSWNGSAPCTPNTPFAAVERAGTSWSQLLEPLYRPGHPEIARHGMAVACFQHLFEGVAAAGYAPYWLDGYDVKGKPYLNVLFRPGSVLWVLEAGLTKAGFQSKLEDRVRQGYRPTFVETYLDGSAVRFAFIAEKRGGPKFEVYHDRSAKDHEQLVDSLSDQGYTPTNVAVVSTKGKLHYTALWEKRTLGGWRSDSTMTAGEYQQWLNDNAKAGRHVVYLNAYHHKGKTRFSAVVSSKASTNYAARHDLSGAGYQAEYGNWRGKGMLTEAVTGYQVGSGHRFAAVWRK